jgi:hypothetical protein
MLIMNDKQIKSVCDFLNIPLIGIFSRDKLPVRKANGVYIINMQGSNQGDRRGTHWVGIYKKGSKKIYFDSFGQEPPLCIIKYLKHFLYSQNRIQDNDSGYCGEFTIVVLHKLVQNGGDLIKALKPYDFGSFSDERINDQILKKEWKNLLGSGTKMPK